MDRSLDRFRSNMPGALDSAQITGTNTNTNPTLDVVNVNNNNEEAVATASPRVPPPPCMVREQDQYMPIANVIRIMRRILPPHAKISDDAKETVQECVSEYISFITGEANERCQREQRKTVTAEDVLWAMGKLGFDNYLEPLSVFLNKYREAEGSDKTTSLFVKRERGPESGMLEYVVPHYGPGGTYAPTTHHQPGMYEAGGGMNGYYRDGGSGGGGSSSSTQGHGQNGAVGGGGFDPFAQFK